MPKKVIISDEDLKLFHNAMKDVSPLASTKIPSHPLPKPIVRSSQGEMETKIFYSDHISNFVTANEKLQFMRSGVQQRYFTKLQKGKLPIEDKLDLHGFTIEQSRTALQQFLAFSSQNGKRVLLIIHGKGGHGSENKPILKNQVNAWLRQDDRILAFCSAQPRDGGTGAVYVLLKRPSS